MRASVSCRIFFVAAWVTASGRFKRMTLDWPTFFDEDEGLLFMDGVDDENPVANHFPEDKFCSPEMATRFTPSVWDRGQVLANPLQCREIFAGDAESLGFLQAARDFRPRGLQQLNLVGRWGRVVH
jgi:hypothetical protein